MAQLSGKTLRKLHEYIELESKRADLDAAMKAAIEEITAQQKPQIEAIDEQLEAITDTIPEAQEDEFYAQEMASRKARAARAA
jgi:Mg2+ and Co2+ transporter CorA